MARGELTGDGARARHARLPDRQGGPCPVAAVPALCTAQSHDPALDGPEIALKGGQMAGGRSFGQVRPGQP